ncbi:MBL fold metallo-hydrolase [Rhodococcus sp. G-MC3]|uniref:MBL fold metallo-hydrolase n=1 Tax=Rhodococcus sp. G-MC3 TaxID=3046209 RepID=UPI0024BB7B0A|nr:MBL fold metallo-hydrolase [Rhodococcus sp. G-MC3]MDJ0395435.1 MBL fold metallo-hydrolase [Rhodococcus sp. G-MC3]
MTLAHPAHGQLRQVTPTASVLLADNPGKMTLDGTNTWILRAPGSEDIVVVDPGPRDSQHLDAVAAVGNVVLVLVTHRHKDHTGGLKRIHRKSGAPVRALSGKYVHGSTPLADGDVVEVAGLSIAVLATPGHTADSLSFVLDDAVLTGDTILGRGTTVLDPKDGTLADYMSSLDRLEAVGEGKITLPGHGPEVADTAEVARFYRRHRQTRLAQVRAALDELGQGAKPMQVVRHVYSDVDKKLWPAARMSVKAQLTYLREN